MPDHCLLTRQVVMIQNGIIREVFPLNKEYPYTEWVPKRLEVRNDAQGRPTLWDDNKPIT